MLVFKLKTDFYFFEKSNFQMGVLEFFNAEQNFEKFDEVPEKFHFEKNDKPFQQKAIVDFTVKSFYGS